MKRYDTIIVGAGASGLYCACALKDGNNLILEKGKRPGLKLLMAGNGQCNITHGGSIKNFIEHYGNKGKFIRGILQKYNNLALRKELSCYGVETVEREDGKVFPASMNGRDVLDALLVNANAQLLLSNDVKSITPLDDGFCVKTSTNEFCCENLVIATGGASYPTTGSDGALAKIISSELGMRLEKLRPALTSVYVENYPYSELSGISFRNVEIRAAGKKMIGDLLLTFKNLSGPVIINNSRDMKPGDVLTLNFLEGMNYDVLMNKIKSQFPGNNKSPLSYMTDELGLPKRFAKLTTENLGFEDRKVSQLSGKEMKCFAKELTEKEFIISGLAGFKEAMATAGGVDLSEISTNTMESKKYPGLYLVGEVLDIDGDTGGYNLQFAYSSAHAAAAHINTKKSATM